MFFCMDWIVALSSSSSEPRAGAVVSTATRSARLTTSFFLYFVVIMRRRPLGLLSEVTNVEIEFRRAIKQVSPHEKVFFPPDKRAGKSVGRLKPSIALSGSS